MHTGTSPRPLPFGRHVILFPIAALSFIVAAAGWLALESLAQGPTPKDPTQKEKHGGNIVFPLTKPTKDIKEHVLFSHEVHIAAGGDCQDCHGKIFKKEKKIGVNIFTMKDINRGKACGACHDGVAKTKAGTPVFAPTKNCARCHNVKWRKKS